MLCYNINFSWRIQCNTCKKPKSVCLDGNVDYGGTAEEQEQYSHGHGAISIKFDGHTKGFTVEFTDKDSVQTAMALDDSLFRGRQIKVLIIKV